MKAIGYIRVSTEDQAREGISLDNQESKVRAYADLHGIELVEVIRDEGISGKSLERPGFERLQGILDGGGAHAVIVYKLDRLSRKTIDILNTLETWEKREIVFHSIKDNIDTKTAAGKFLLTILSALAQMERDLIAERTIDALSYKKKNGEWCGRVPFGFSVHGTRLIENSEQISIIQKAKRMKRRGKSYRAISKALSLPLGSVYNMVNNNLKTAKAAYLKELR